MHTSYSSCLARNHKLALFFTHPVTSYSSCSTWWRWRTTPWSCSAGTCSAWRAAPGFWSRTGRRICPLSCHQSDLSHTSSCWSSWIRGSCWAAAALFLSPCRRAGRRCSGRTYCCDKNWTTCQRNPCSGMKTAFCEQCSLVSPICYCISHPLPSSRIWESCHPIFRSVLGPVSNQIAKQY